MFFRQFILFHVIFYTIFISYEIVFRFCRNLFLLFLTAGAESWLLSKVACCLFSAFFCHFCIFLKKRKHFCNKKAKLKRLCCLTLTRNVFKNKVLKLTFHKSAMRKQRLVILVLFKIFFPFIHVSKRLKISSWLHFIRKFIPNKDMKNSHLDK